MAAAFSARHSRLKLPNNLTGLTVGHIIVRPKPKQKLLYLCSLMFLLCRCLNSCLIDKRRIIFWSFSITCVHFARYCACATRFTFDMVLKGVCVKRPNNQYQRAVIHCRRTGNLCFISMLFFLLDFLSPQTSRDLKHEVFKTSTRSLSLSTVSILHK